VTWIFHVTVTEEFDMAVSYKALTGIDYPPNKRVEAGEVVSDLPAQSIKWLLDSGLIEDSSKPAKKIQEPVIEEIKAEVPVEVEVVAEPVAEETPFKPNAKDGDGDGFVQDGTTHQRPVEEK
jgi:hypothetical protein